VLRLTGTQVKEPDLALLFKERGKLVVNSKKEAINLQ
jgi:hypothetical protein